MLTLSLLLAAASPSLVVHSVGPSAATYPRGARVTLPLTLQPGDALTLLDARGTRVVKGPGVATAAGAPIPAALARARRIVMRADTRHSTAAATRAKPPKPRAVETGLPPSRSRSPNLWYVDAIVGGTVCVPSAQPVNLWSARAARPATVEVRDAAGTKIGTAKMGSGAAVRILSDRANPAGAYTLAWPDGRTVAFELKAIAAPPGGDVDGLQAIASALMTAGCDDQLRLLLESA